jgi:cytidylate kinase
VRVTAKARRVARHLQVAIDGPAASGKTTVARAVARRLGALYLDTGAMYRALALLALRSGTDADNGAALARLASDAQLHVTLDDGAPLGFRIAARDRDIDARDLQSAEVTAIVSTVAAQPEVRNAMVAAQRRIAGGAAVVMAGRDIGTVVLPDAAVKVYLTASHAARIERRRAQLEASGVNVDEHRLAQEIDERDLLDRTRAVSPMEPAPGAHLIDSSDVDAAHVVDQICAIANSVAGEA